MIELQKEKYCADILKMRASVSKWMRYSRNFMSANISAIPNLTRHALVVLSLMTRLPIPWAINLPHRPLTSLPKNQNMTKTLHQKDHLCIPPSLFLFLKDITFHFHLHFVVHGCQSSLIHGTFAIITSELAPLSRKTLESLPL